MVYVSLDIYLREYHWGMDDRQWLYQWLTMAEACAEIRVSQKTMRRYISDGKLQARKFSGQTLRIRRADLLAMGEVVGR